MTTNLLRYLTLVVSLLPHLLEAKGHLIYGDSSDLTNFVTHPEIKAPILNVSIHDPDEASAGYWFMTPFHRTQEPLVASPSYYVPCQAGPTIYDEFGDLVWSGACIVQNNNTFDFRLVTIANNSYLSWMRQTQPRNTPNNMGIGEIFDLGYQNKTDTQATNATSRSNFHEFNHIEKGWNALVITEEVRYLDLIEIGLPYTNYPVDVTGFQEVNLKTGEILFKWDSISHVSLTESSLLPENPKPNADDSEAFDFMHMNSVDKNAEGDYLISARHTDTIYKISGASGKVLWRFGGKKSDFVHDGFNFSKQHDARFLESNSTHTIVSFVNNAASKYAQSASHSSALVVSLHTAANPMTASLINWYDRPDKGLTRRMGNVQTLLKGTRLVNWSEGGYITEWSSDGRLALEAKFASDRFASYRVYKHEFIGRPMYPPRLRAFLYGQKLSTATTACYVSWNGATEVASWRFYTHEGSKNVLLGEVSRQGFETEFMCDGYQRRITAEAVDVNGVVLGQSEIEEAVRPGHWETQVSEETPASDYISGHGPRPVTMVLCLFLTAAFGFAAGSIARPRWPGQRKDSGKGYKQLAHEEEELERMGGNS